MRLSAPLRRGYKQLAGSGQLRMMWWWCQPLKRCCALALLSLVVTVLLLILRELEYLEGGQLFIAGAGSTRLLFEPAKSSRNIFFIETSCALVRRRRFPHYAETKFFTLNNRQACAVESAARTYPDRDVYVLHTCPSVGIQGWSDASRQAVDYENVKLVEVDPLGFFARTPLEQWATSGLLERSTYPVVHASDVFRLLALWKYGGLYLDLDIISFRSTGELENFVVLERNSSVNNAVVHLSPYGLGHDVATDFLTEIASDFRGVSWNYNGPLLVTRTLLRRCNVSKALEFRKDRCGGFTVLGIPAFYPLTYEQWYWMFDEGQTDEVRRMIASSYGLHMWNSISSSHHPIVSTRAALSLIMKQHCPRVYDNSDRLL